MRKIESKILGLSEEKNALDYLEKAYYYIQKTDEDVIAWKWVVLSLHGGLYAFAVCALTWGNYKRVTYTNKKGVERLISFDEALRRCQQPNYMRISVGGNELQLSSEQKESIKKLKQIRNRLEHYIPMSWRIYLDGIPEVVINVLDVIRFLVLNTSNQFNFSENRKKRVKSIVFQCKKILKKSSFY